MELVLLACEDGGVRNEVELVPLACEDELYCVQDFFTIFKGHNSETRKRGTIIFAWDTLS